MSALSSWLKLRPGAQLNHWSDLQQYRELSEPFRPNLLLVELDCCPGLRIRSGVVPNIYLIFKKISEFGSDHKEKTGFESRSDPRKIWIHNPGKNICFLGLPHNIFSSNNFLQSNSLLQDVRQRNLGFNTVQLTTRFKDDANRSS